MTITYGELKETFRKILLSRGLTEADADEAATVFANNSLDGVYSHGVNRFPKIIGYLDSGAIKPDSGITKVDGFMGFERWDGHKGMGPLNASKAMNRACELAKQYGIGLVALGNNNHWLRGGSYGWQAADNGCIGICWSNASPFMPAWGSKENRIGNNPIVFAIPRTNGQHVVIDCALSQYSFGKMDEYRMKGQQIPYFGGYDTNGNLSKDPAEIIKAKRFLPTGLWKGSGISIALDVIATVLSNGNSVKKIGEFGDESGVTQIMIAINPEALNSKELTDQIVNDIVNDVTSSEPEAGLRKVIYPGEIEWNNRKKNMKEGIPVNDEVWAQIQAL